MPRSCLAACLALAALWWQPAAGADGGCPQLPGADGLRWEQRDVPGMVLCKALAADGTELVSVILGRSLAFRAEGSLNVGRGTIDGRKVRWYRGSDGFDAGVVLRETVVKLGGGREAHVVIRAPSEDAATERMQLVEGLRFGDE